MIGAGEPRVRRPGHRTGEGWHDQGLAAMVRRETARARGGGNGNDGRRAGGRRRGPGGAAGPYRVGVRGRRRLLPGDPGGRQRGAPWRHGHHRGRTIRGGPHVLMIGTYGSSAEPTVSISDVTVTGGLARSSPESVPLFGKPGVWAAGGGIEIPPGAHLAAGATVTITDSVITGNRVNSSASVPSGIPCPGGFPKGQCPFAPAWGGGIDSWGALRLIRTAVTGNTAGAAPGEPGTTSDADGAGIFSREGSLTLDGSVVSGNSATAVLPAGRFAEGAGIFAGVPDFGPGANAGHDALILRNSVISGNVASLTSKLPGRTGGKLLDQKANGGAVLVAAATPTTVENSRLTKNSVVATDLNGEPVAINAAIVTNGDPLAMAGSVVSGNRAVTTAATLTDQGAAGGALEIDGGGSTLGPRITGNSSATMSPHGLAAVAGALGLFANTSLLTVQDTPISGNT